MARWAAIGIDGGLVGAVVGISQDLRILGWFDIPVIEDTKKTTVKRGKNVGQSTISTKRRFDVPGLWRQLTELVTSLESKGYSVMIFFEKARPMPKQGVSSTFQTGRGFGIVEMALAALGRIYHVVEPTKWQLVSHAGVTGSEPKVRSFTQSARLFPGLPLTKPNGRVPSMDGRADAALIAYYGIMSVCSKLGVDPEESKGGRSSSEEPKSKRTPVRREAYWGTR
jgi:hypothetical protein